MTPPGLAYRQVLRLPSVAALLTATCLARLAGRMFTLAIVLFALDRFASPEMAGWLASAAVAPGLIASPLAGALLDRIGAPVAIVIDMAASAALVGMLVVLTDAGPWPLLGIVGLYSLTTPLGTAGIRALLPRLVPETALDRANALDTSIHGLINVVGPAVAGVMVGLAGAQATMLVIAGLYAVAALRLLKLARRPGGPVARARSLLHEAVAGVIYVARHRSLRGLAVAYSLYMVGWGILVVAVPVYVARDLGFAQTRDSVVGLLWALSGITGSAGALLAGHVGALGRERRFIALGTLVTGMAMWPVCATAGIAGLVIGLALVGLLEGPVDVGVLTLRQRRTEPGRLGRVLAVSMSVNLAGLPVGSALGGALMVWSSAAAFATAAATCALAALAAWTLIPASDERALT